jgi:hypothetical protein
MTIFERIRYKMNHDTNESILIIKQDMGDVYDSVRPRRHTRRLRA